MNRLKFRTCVCACVYTLFCLYFTKNRKIKLLYSHPCNIVQRVKIVNLSIKLNQQWPRLDHYVKFLSNCEHVRRN